MSGILSLVNVGAIGVSPQDFRYTTNDTLATITSAGYINPIMDQAGFSMQPGDTLTCQYNNYSEGAIFMASYNGKIITLVDIASTSEIVLPTIANHIATFTNTTGTIGEDAAAAINGGNIQAGLSGTAGYLASFPGTASKGSFRFLGVANTGNTVTTFSNNAMGQATSVNIPDPGNAIAQVLIGATATPFTTGHLIASSGTGGLTADSGISTTNVTQNNISNTLSGAGRIIAAKVNGVETSNAVTASGMSGVITTSSLTTAAGGTYSITWTNTFISPTSTVLLSIQGGTNAVQTVVMTVAPGTGTATLVINNIGPTNALAGTILIGYLVI
jgi:hypothetical protein